MNMVNSSTGFTPFLLKTGRSLCIIPPLIATNVADVSVLTLEGEAARASALIKQLEVDVLTTQDNLLAAMTSQALYVNTHRSKEDIFEVGDLVMLSTLHRRRDYMQRGEARVAK
ncbi:hypothetical protein JAAARDRAFT_110212, partial [Jaapia argillacea MUCL 33604]